jgi:3-methylfumaryl-CoA hydratase
MSNGELPARYEDWIGRSETRVETASPEPVERLADLLDHVDPPWPPASLPPLGHWLYFTPRVLASEIDIDGHPKRGDFLPPIALPRRMWAGSEVEFHAPIPLGAQMRRTTRIADIRHKTGSTGELIFVTLVHEIGVEDQLALRERQDIVYREPAPASAAIKDTSLAARSPDVERRVALSPPDLFRFSALTYNAHRIHYDRDYARDVEGYAGLVVHGPFAATLLMDHLLRSRPGADVQRFSFRGVRPLLDLAPFSLCLAWQEGGASLWCRDEDGAETMTADAVLR